MRAVGSLRDWQTAPSKTTMAVAAVLGNGFGTSSSRIRSTNIQWDTKRVPLADMRISIRQAKKHRNTQVIARDVSCIAAAVGRRGGG